MQKPKPSAGPAKKERLTYDVVRASDGELPELNAKELGALRTAFGATFPSGALAQFLEYATASFIRDAIEVRKAHPSQVERRLDTARTCANSLLVSLRNLEPTEHVMLSNRKASAWPVTERLPALIADLDGLLAELAPIPKKGRMPAYAEQGLALNVDQALFEESGAFASCGRDGQFARILKAALEIADSRLGRRDGNHTQGRRDVASLLKFAKANRHEWTDLVAEQKLLDLFRHQAPAE